MCFFTPQEWISLRGVGFTERSGFLHSPGVEGSEISLRGVGFFTTQEWISEGVSFTKRSVFLHSPGVDFIEGSGFY